ncbi:MAG: 50S ribosomal protein L3 [Leptospiraceae bacterium]|nr:50S ribosomal protein L3 [Leptospiraceae bacterium]
MTTGLIGRKIGMSRVYKDNGDMVPVTVIQVGPCSVSQVKTPEKDGYYAVQLAYGDVKEKNLSKPEMEHLKKNGISPKRHLKEFKIDGDAPALGSTISVTDVFKELDNIKVTGTTKGKGFQGVVKRFGHAGGPQAHGSRFHRHPGSSGANSTPSRIFKGVKRPGRMGSIQKTVKELKIVKIFTDENIILVSGSVPGSNKSLVTVEKV